MPFFKIKTFSIVSTIICSLFASSVIADTLTYKKLVKDLVVTQPVSTTAIIGYSTTALDFGSLAVSSTTAAQSVIISNTGTASASISNITADTSEYSVSTNCGAQLSPGQSCIASVTFTPSAAGLKAGALSVTTSKGLQIISLVGTGLQSNISHTPATSANFGSVFVGQFEDLTFNVSNTGNTSISGIYPTVTGTGISIIANTCGTQAAPMTKSPGAGCSYTVRFSPSSEGALTASATLHSSLPDSSISLTGAGVPALSPIATLSSQNLSFTTLVGSTSVVKQVQLSNTGTANLSVDTNISVSGSSAAMFDVSHNCGANLTPAESCVLSVTFSPNAAGQKYAAINITTGDGVKTVSLTGAAQAAVDANVSALLYTQSSLSALTYPDTTVNQTSTKYAYVLASGDVGSLVSHVEITGADATAFEVTDAKKYLISYSNEFWASTASCGATLSGQISGNCTADPVESIASDARNNIRFAIAFKPTSAGLKSATLKVYHNGASANPVEIALSGTATQITSVAYSTTSLAFGSVNVGSTASLTFSIINDGDLPVTINTPTTNSPIVSYSGCTEGTLNVAQSCIYTVGITPTASGAINATFTVNTSAGSQPISITGTGLGKFANLSASGGTGFGAITNGNTASKTITFANSGNLALSSIYASLTGNGFTLTANNCGTQGSPLSSLAAGASCTMTVQFAPSLNPTEYSAVLSVASDALNAPSSLTFTGSTSLTTSASISPSVLSFGAVAVNTTSTAQTITLSNTGNTPVTITSATVLNAGTANISTNTTCGASLAVNSSCDYSVTFQPTDNSSVTANLNIVTNAGTKVASITGSGQTNSASLTPLSNAAFGSAKQGQTVSKTFTFSNTGNTSLTGVYATLTGSDFTMTANSCGTQASPVSIAASGTTTCSITVQFAPTLVQAYSGTLTVVSSATTSPNTLNLTGTGTDATVFLATYDSSYDAEVGGTATASGSGITRSLSNGDLVLGASSNTAAGYLAYPVSTDYNFGTGDFYWEATITRTAHNGGTSSAGLLTFSDGTAANSFFLFIEDRSTSDARLSFQAGSGISGSQSYWLATGSGSIQLNTTYKVAIKRKNGQMSLLINDVAQTLTKCNSSTCTSTGSTVLTTEYATGTYSTSSTRVWIGNKSSNNAPFKGRIANIKATTYVP